MITAIKSERNILRLDDLVPFLIPTAMYIFGKSEVSTVLRMWLFIIFVGSFFFAGIGLHAGHHNPQNIHEGDELPSVLPDLLKNYLMRTNYTFQRIHGLWNPSTTYDD